MGPPSSHTLGQASPVSGRSSFDTAGGVGRGVLRAGVVTGTMSEGHALSRGVGGVTAAAALGGAGGLGRAAPPPQGGFQAEGEAQRRGV